MADQFESLNDEHMAFIREQRMFFVGTAAADGRVNVSPKGQGSLEVVGPNSIVWLNLTGSGNETAAHLKQQDRITLMWCAFDGPPRILRAYGQGQVVHPRDAEWQRWAALIPAPVGARQYVRVEVDLVQTSCGYAVPRYQFLEQRTALDRWADHRGPEGIERYWAERNTVSLDGLPTGILEDAAPEMMATRTQPEAE
ncbi:MAG: pyridoxamine 5'-phosphate oxidase family protein [Pseudomonadales bacterium]